MTCCAHEDGTGHASAGSTAGAATEPLAVDSQEDQGGRGCGHEDLGGLGQAELADPHWQCRSGEGAKAWARNFSVPRMRTSERFRAMNLRVGFPSLRKVWVEAGGRMVVARDSENDAIPPSPEVEDANVGRQTQEERNVCAEHTLLVMELIVEQVAHVLQVHSSKGAVHHAGGQCGAERHGYQAGMQPNYGQNERTTEGSRGIEEVRSFASRPLVAIFRPHRLPGSAGTVCSRLALHWPMELRLPADGPIGDKMDRVLLSSPNAQLCKQTE